MEASHSELTTTGKEREERRRAREAIFDKHPGDLDAGIREWAAWLTARMERQKKEV
jgi:hypothetical protein